MARDDGWYGFDHESSDKEIVRLRGARRERREPATLAELMYDRDPWQIRPSRRRKRKRDRR